LTATRRSLTPGDEVYFVVRGKGLFFDGERRHKVEVVSFLVVPAGQAHRFEDFSSDFVVWVVFHGPEGGESNGKEKSGGRIFIRPPAVKRF
jgi:mannose-6-phosphate isomerase-like protein (cupin superfamily)